jgi:hypothetical protein
MVWLNKNEVLLFVQVPFQFGVGNETDLNPRLPSHMPFQSHLTWHSSTKVASGFLSEVGFP